MNAVANHGYVARNGYTNTQEAITAIMKVYGVGPTIADGLATIAAVQAGDGFHFSIGGPAPATLPVLGGLLGLYDLPGRATVNPNYDVNLLGNAAVNRYHQSVSQNPYYFRGFFGFTIPPGTHAFIYRMFSNKSVEYPEGFLDRNTLKSFYGITGEGDSLKYTPGTERIPNNWYTHAIDDPYSAPFFFSDFKNLIQQHPELSAFGGNTGTVNSFTGIDITNLTGGLYNAETLLQGNNLGCFLFQSLAVAAPDTIRGAGVIADIAGAVAKINNAVGQILDGLGCPEPSRYDYDDSQLAKYPGYTKLR
ncbi:MAG: hypothetical protein HETSPECPRED_004374 [Heterodermia speciosa]|uniref:Heme haloperoxidase family profile domain-containing protein n=1 Tax=Heterodermia speciosa TaxID=116794 RepID=A0A8H3F8V8_9LECA|nr:MAG: hypothetical protein HETSPECPRED_004374 [Heterodermia speciosa]